MVFLGTIEYLRAFLSAQAWWSSGRPLRPGTVKRAPENGHLQIPNPMDYQHLFHRSWAASGYTTSVSGPTQVVFEDWAFFMAIWDDELGKCLTQLVGDLPSSRDALLCPNDWQ